ncbi:Resuscitation-promoting factor Rpf2 precursor [Arthrobacter saudimassiliensis]|uniref:Resuscitation-promoting factor Rpf2 n=1 Tax=Arthrobacter saudimassiliensis TaxID=1461584 RepID=A0A078MJF5_9MICC|nr:Resuscitation-promoting factor Rpf2 precursor [Arthrobacter saudimassiliensis]
MAALVLGLVAFVGNNKTVEISVDGQASDVQTFGGTVEDVLERAGVSVEPADQVTPALGSEVGDGARIEVLTAKTVDITLDGAGHTVQTTGSTVEDLVSELRVSAASAVSASFDTSLAGLDRDLSITTPKTVTLLVDGGSREHSTTARNVGELLEEAGVRLGTSDRVSAPAQAAVVDGMVLKVTRLSADGEETVTEAVPFETVEAPNADLPEGERKVTREGVPGEKVSVFRVVTVDGREASRTLVTSSVTREPVAEEVAVGTKKRPAAASGSAPAGGAWAALAQCESGGNWHINSGNGYYGGLQFSASSWLGAGGGKYAPVASDATPAQQIEIAENLRASGGWGHWPSCAAKLGLL